MQWEGRPWLHLAPSNQDKNWKTVLGVDSPREGTFLALIGNIRGHSSSNLGKRHFRQSAGLGQRPGMGRSGSC